MAKFFTRFVLHILLFMSIVIVTGRNEVVAKVMFLQVCVCPQGGRVSASVHAGIPDPPRPGRQTPPRDQAGRSPPPRPGRQIPPSETRQADPLGPGRPPPLWTRQTPLRTRHTPPQTRQTPPRPGRTPLPGKQTAAYCLRAAGTHSTGMHSCWHSLFFSKMKTFSSDKMN